MNAKPESFQYFAVYKPYGMLSQFTPEGNKPGLGSLHSFPKDVYSVGRLDADSEGLLLLSNDNRFKSELLDPDNQHPRCYWVQVEGEIHEDAIQKLQNGLEIRVRKKLYRTRKAKARVIPEPDLPPRVPPVRYRANIPTSWLEIILTEGKNRQVRKMTAKVGFPTLRLVRSAIAQYSMGKRESAEVWALKKEDLGLLGF